MQLFNTTAKQHAQRKLDITERDMLCFHHNRRLQVDSGLGARP
jgi:hypothetical protein